MKKLFLSYPSVQRELAERLALALEAEGHEVFIDRSDLKAGESFHQRLREAILSADAMVFLVTPEAVRPGSYALAELDIARQRWRRPGGYVLPVMVAPTPMAALPPYLSAVTVLEPRGDAVAEIVAAVQQMASPARAGRKWLVVAAVALALVAAAAFMFWRQAGQAAAEAARRAAEQRDLAQATSARELCFTGGYAVALAQLNELAARQPAQAAVLDAREDCAMRWLRDMRATVGRQTFGEQVAQAQPLLLEGMARAGSAERRADLRAHVGWGEYLRSRDGTAGLDPASHWRRALDEDPANPYAHAMWAHQLLDKPGRFDEARTHFAAAASSGRSDTRPFVRALQFNTLYPGANENLPYAIGVADEMRRAKEPMLPDHRDRFWSYVFATRMLEPDSRAAVLSSLPPAELLATFLWMFPDADVSPDRRRLWRFNLATLQANNGDMATARQGLQALLEELQAGGQSGRLLDQTRFGLDRLGGATGVKAKAGTTAAK